MMIIGYLIARAWVGVIDLIWKVRVARARRQYARAGRDFDWDSIWEGIDG